MQIKQFFQRKNIIISLAGLGIAASSFFAGVLVTKHQTPSGIFEATPNYRGTTVRLGLSELTNPLLWCDIVGANEVIPEYQTIQTALQKNIASHIAAHDADQVSLYLMALNTGRRIAINEQDHFSPASMLKVVIMIAYEKMAGTDPTIMDHQIVYDGSFDEDAIEMTQNPEPLKRGSSYTVRELIRNMIVDSGNNSRRLLKDYLSLRDPSYLNTVYADLRLGDPPADGGDYMTTEEYSSVFRVLYNTTYLSRQASEDALKLLIDAKFQNGLVAGVPETIKVAHKFGERQMANADGAVINEFHDCGIVYYTGHPYFLCIMTKGSDETQLMTTVRDLSHEAYIQMDHYFTAVSPSVPATKSAS